MVGEALGTKLVRLGHKVKMGSRTANNESAVRWVKSVGANASQGNFNDAASFGEMIFVCLKGAVFLEVAKMLVGSALRASATERPRKPPGTL